MWKINPQWRAYSNVSIHLGQNLILKEITKQLQRFAYTNQDMPDYILNKHQEMYYHPTPIRKGGDFKNWNSVRPSIPLMDCNGLLRTLKTWSVPGSWLGTRARVRNGPKQERRFMRTFLRIPYISSLSEGEL